MSDFDWGEPIGGIDGIKNEVPPVAAPQNQGADDYTWKKGHNVPGGAYLVKLVDVKCHNKTTYKLKVEILPDTLLDKEHFYSVITGYARRDKYGYYDLANCFGDGVLRKPASAYVGGVGIIDLTDSGWITLRNKEGYPKIFPGFKGIHSPTDDDNSFEAFLKLFK